MSYADRTKRPPRTLTDAEQAKLLKASGQHADTFRDHMIFSFAFGCGLRQMEIAGLDVCDVADDRGLKAKRTIELRVYKGSRRQRGKTQRIHLPDGTYYKLAKYLAARFRTWRPMPTEPLFVGRGGRRLSTRRMREIWMEWQARAGIEQRYRMHEARHTAITNVYRATRDIRIAQRVARHARIDTTTRYEHASDQEVADAVRKLAS